MRYINISFEKLREYLKGNRKKLTATVFKKREDGLNLILDIFRFSGSKELLTRLKKIQKKCGTRLYINIK